MKLLAFAGRKKSGKDTAAKMLSHDYENVKFAGPIKAMLRIYLEYRGVDCQTINRMLEGDLKEEPSKLFGGKSTRRALQTLGTEWGRNLIDKDIWINSFEDKAKQYPYVVCTDVRFPDEINFVHQMGGKVAKINRDTKKSEATKKSDCHISETLIDSLQVDFDIDNSDSLEYLELQVRDFENG